MKYSVEFKLETISDLERLTQVVRERLLSKVDWLAENFEQIAPQSLSSNLSGLFKLRVGDYRVLYSFDNEQKIITIHRIGHRSTIYG